MTDAFIEAENFAKEFGAVKVPDFRNMNRYQFRKYFKELFVKAIQDYQNDNFVEKAFCIKELLCPKSIFQYRDFDENNYKLKALEENYVWLSKPSAFNDPYDCAGCFDVEKALAEIYLSKPSFNDNRLIKQAKLDIQNGMNVLQATLKNIKSIPKEIAEEIIKKEQKVIRDKLANLKERMQNTIKITCFSETYQNILMWSHYAKNHTGFCVEYDISKLEINNDFKMKFYPVIYTQKPIDISKAISVQRIDICKNILAANKSQDWEYEREWRYITSVNHDSKLIMPVPPKAVYAGTKISEENKQKLIKIAEKYNIPCYKLITKSDSFDLEIGEKIN